MKKSTEVETKQRIAINVQMFIPVAVIATGIGFIGTGIYLAAVSVLAPSKPSPQAAPLRMITRADLIAQQIPCDAPTVPFPDLKDSALLGHTSLIPLRPQPCAPEYAPGELLVKFKNDQAVNDIKFALRSGGSPLTIGLKRVGKITKQHKLQKLDKVFKHTPSQQELKQKFPKRAARAPKNVQAPDLSRIYKLEFPQTTDIRSLARQYSTLSDVEYAEPNFLAQIAIKKSPPIDEPGPTPTLVPAGAPLTPNDPYFSSTGSWGQSYADMWGLKRMKMEQAWGKSTGVQRVIVAVSDTGIDYNHEDLQGQIWMNPGERPGNNRDDDGNGYVDDIRGWNFWFNNNNPLDDNGHGTHVAGTIGAATDNNLGVAGITWNVQLMNVKAIGYGGGGYVDILAESIDYAVNNGADVINMSWGGSFSQVIHDALERAYANGVVGVAAAGNESTDVMYAYPANEPHVITAAAWDYDEARTWFSNWGNRVDVAAPGAEVLSLRAAGTDMYGGGVHIIGNSYYRASGTSMAAPHVAGVAALLLSVDPSFSPDLIREIIRSTAEDVAYPGKDDESGFGLLSGPQALTLASTVRSGPELAELAILSLTFPKNGIDWLVPTMDIANLGKVSSSSVDYKVFGGDIKENKVVSQGQIPTLVPGEYFTVRGEPFPIYALSEVYQYLSVQLDTAGAVNEYTDQNNVRQESIYPALWKDLAGYLESTPTVAKLSPTSAPAIIMGAGDGKVYAWYGKEYNPFTKVFQEVDLGSGLMASPAVADIDSDGNAEVVIGTVDGKVYVLQSNGSIRSNWPQTAGTHVRSSPAIGDIDPANPGPEIVIGGGDGRVYAWRANGTPVPGWPRDAGGKPIFSTPAIADINRDGRLDVVIGGGDGKVYAWQRKPDSVEWEYLPGSWPVPTGGVIESSPAVADLTPAGPGLEIVIGSDDQKVYAWKSDGTSLTGWPKSVGAQVRSSPAVADLDQNGLLDVIVPSYAGQVYAWNGAGQTLSGWPKSAGFSVHSSPAVADLNADSFPEVIISSGDGFVYTFWGNNVKLPPHPILADSIPYFMRSSPVVANTSHVPASPKIVVGGRVNAKYNTLFLLRQRLASPDDPDPWPTFRGNVQRTGVYAPAE